MVDNLSVIEAEDPSVSELLNKTAKELHEKYNKQRKINERFLKKKTPVKRVFSRFFDVLCILLLVVGFVVCFASINTTINGYLPNFAGYTNLVISSKSMVASGYNVGDVVIIHSVDAKTLNVGDKIAFYVYPFSYTDFNVEDTTQINQTSAEHKYTLTFPQLFGFQTDEVKKAARIKSNVVFHHIRAIYEDENGIRWFKTYGSSNGSDDTWWINENYILGVEDDGVVSKTVLGLVQFAAKPYGVLVLALPLILLIVVLVFTFLKNIQIAKLELDCVEEKRKITDPICVKNGVGFQMSTNTKFKILAQANDENKEEYIKLLWKKGTLPNSVKKYFLRKKLLLNTNKELLKLNRECEGMFKDGVKPTQIAKHYLTEKERIETKGEAIRKRLKSIDKHRDNNIKISAKAKAKLNEVSNVNNVQEDLNKETKADSVVKTKRTNSSSVTRTKETARTQTKAKISTKSVVSNKTTSSKSKTSSTSKAKTSNIKSSTSAKKTASAKTGTSVNKPASKTQVKNQSQKKKN